MREDHDGSFVIECSATGHKVSVLTQASREVIVRYHTKLPQSLFFLSTMQSSRVSVSIVTVYFHAMPLRESIDSNSCGEGAVEGATG